MTTPTFTDPPADGPPSIADPTNFAVRADAVWAWLFTLFDELVAFVAWLVALGDTYQLSLYGTSTTSLTLAASGSKTLTTQTGLGFRVGVTIYVADASGNKMWGPVTAYDSGAGELTLTSIGMQGSGSGTAWTIGPEVVAANKTNYSQTPIIAKGNSGTGTVTFSVAAGEVQTLTNTGAHTWAITWMSGHSELEIIVTNAGANAITMPTINWLRGDGTMSTTFSNMGVTLQASGKNHFLLWSPDGGTTVYGRAG